jgi:hypothetical protein
MPGFGDFTRESCGRIGAEVADIYDAWNGDEWGLGKHVGDIGWIERLEVLHCWGTRG